MSGDAEVITESDSVAIHISTHNTTPIANLHRLIKVDTGAGLDVVFFGANPNVPATSVDKQLVCIRQSIGSRNFSLENKLTISAKAANGKCYGVAIGPVEDRLVKITAVERSGPPGRPRELCLAVGC